jgi:outer membrane protein OmpA-like peptidoglycan-associated protein/predicted RNA-binding protein with TRAM domain
MALGLYDGVAYRVRDSLTTSYTASPSSSTATFSGLAIHGPTGTTPEVGFYPNNIQGTATTVSITSAGNPYRLELTRASVGTSTGTAFTTQPQVTIKDLAGNVVTSDSSTVVTATISSGGTLVGTATATAVNGVATFSNLGLAGTIGTAYEISYTSGSLTQASQIITVTQASQTIAFGTLAGKTYGDVPFTVSATSSAGLTVTFASTTTGVCTVAGSTVTIVTAGTCTIRASQSGDASTGAAADVDQSFAIAQATQTVTFGALTGMTYGDPVFTLSATSTSGLTVAFASTTSGVCTVAGSTVTIVTAGTCTIRASQAGDTNYSAASSVDQSFAIAQAAQAGVFLTSTTGTYGSTVALTSSGGSGTGAVTYAVTSAGTAGCSISSTTLSATGAGTCTVTVTKASDTNYLARSSTATTVTIGQAAQSITFASLSNATYGDPTFGLGATASSGLAVTYASADLTICSVSGSTVSIVGSGTCTITASQAGNANYSAATAVPRSFTIDQAAQATLSITSPSTAIYGETISLAAAGGSGTGALVFGVTAGTCIVSGTTLTLGNAGSTCRVQATKVSDANYLSTTSSVQTITISRAGQVVSFTSSVPSSPLPNGTYAPTASSISTVTGSSSSLTPSFSIRGSSSSICSISGGVVSFLTTGNCIIDADSALTTNFTAAATASQTISVGSLNQNIAFTQPANVSFGTSSVSMGATATSGLDVAYTRGSGTTNTACSVSTLGVVTILAVGTCEVVAAQSGDAQYAAASSVTRAFQVVASLPSAPHIGSASAGDQAITVSFTAPGFTGGVAISAYRLVATPTGSGSIVTTTACTSSPCTIAGLVNGTEYTVTAAAINSAGTGTASSASTALTPATAAYAVSDLAAVAGDTIVNVSWTSLTVAQLGGGTFTRYEVYSRVAGTSSWILWTNALTSRTDHSTTVTGLSNGTSYDFRVVAITSANGSQIAGNTAEVVQYPSSTPSAPRSVTTLATTATDIQVSWQAPLTDGGAALISPYYSVSLTSTSAGATTPITCTFASATDRFCSATGLTNGAVYTVSVSAINRMGAGTASTTSYAVPSSDATLSAIEVNSTAGAVAISPAFAAGTDAYTAQVSSDVTAVTVTATTSVAASTMTIEGAAEVSGVASASIPLTTGINTITIVVTASDPRYSETYTISITRAADTRSGGGSWVPGLEVIVPATTLISGSNVGAVIENGAVVPTVLTRNSTDSGWSGVGEGFAFTVSVLGPTGRPEIMTPSGVMRATVGSSLSIRGDGYQPESSVAAFAVPRETARSDAQSVMRMLTSRAASGSVYLGSITANASGVVSGSIVVSDEVSAGDYVLQLNGYTTESGIRSLNLALNVIAAPSVTRVVKKSLEYKAFYQGGSDRFTVEGVDKMREIAKSVPKNARNVKVKITGVSVALDSVADNVELAAKRAQRISDYLVAKGIQGDYEVTFTTSFSVGGDRDGAGDKPEKPLTSVAISYEVPVPSSTT